MSAGHPALRPDGLDEEIKIVDDALAKAVEFGFEPSVWFDWAEKACRERRINPFEQLEKDKADRVAVREELIAARAGEFGDKALGTEL